MNILDKVVGFIAPGAGFKRVQSRAQMLAMDGQVRKYEGAAEGRRHSGWLLRNNPSVNQVIQKDLKNLVSRSRELSINNPYARKAPYTIANSVVGTGIIPTPVIGKMDISSESDSGKDSTKVLEIIKRTWGEWGETSQCDYDGDSSFYGMQWLAMKTIVVSGEVLAIRKRVKSDQSRIGLQIKLLEGDFIDTNKNNHTDPDGGYTLYGIKFNKDFKRAGYWIYDRHPSEGDAVSYLIPIEDIIHVYDLERAGQTRGVPFAASTILKQRDLDDYEDAELLGKKAASCMPIFVTNSSVESGTNNLDDKIEHIEPGAVNYLQAGESVTFATPPANNGFSEFTKTQHRGIANGYLMSYEQYTGDLSNVNFSSGRMGWLEFQREVETLQYIMLIPKFCDKAFKWFAEAVSVSESIPNATISATWTAPRRQMIDPVKETNAKRVAMRSGIQSWSETVRQDGYNPDEVLQELINDQNKFTKGGLMPDWSPFFELMAAAQMAADKQKSTDNTTNK